MITLRKLILQQIQRMTILQNIAITLAIYNIHTTKYYNLYETDGDDIIINDVSSTAPGDNNMHHILL